jgi:electron transport complex protein RnfD
MTSPPNTDAAPEQPGDLSPRREIDILIGLLPLAAIAIWQYGSWARWRSGAVLIMLVCMAAASATAAAIAILRRRPLGKGDMWAPIAGLVVALFLPWDAPWYLAAVAGVAAILIASLLAGRDGEILFNPAMLGLAVGTILFPVTIAFCAIGGSDAITGATPISGARLIHTSAAGHASPLWPLFLGGHTGVLADASAIATIVGGLYVCLRRAIAWEIPAAMILAVWMIAGTANHFWPDATPNALVHLVSGGCLFAAFFAAPWPQSTPAGRLGKILLGTGIGAGLVAYRIANGAMQEPALPILAANLVAILCRKRKN